ncbi:hypothetical protein [Rhodomicrobium vannielii]|nr:hypothetical protein [Rhodomicrobium vannielii]
MARHPGSVLEGETEARLPAFNEAARRLDDNLMALISPTNA